MFFFFHFLHSNVPDNKGDKRKWCMLFFTRTKLVVCVLVCAHAMACIKWIRLKLNPLYLHYQCAYGHQNWQNDDLP